MAFSFTVFQRQVILGAPGTWVAGLGFYSLDSALDYTVGCNRRELARRDARIARTQYEIRPA